MIDVNNTAESMSSLDWYTSYAGTLVTILLTAFLTSLCGYYFTTRKTKKDQKNRAQYLAITIAVSLEHFAIHVVKNLQDYDFQKDPLSNFGEPDLNIPELTEFPKSEDYIYLPSALYDKACNFHDECEFAVHSTNLDKAMQGSLCPIHIPVEDLIILANTALEIADSFRKHYTIQVRSLVFGKNNIRKVLNEGAKK